MNGVDLREAYAVLGVSPGTNEAGVREAYRDLAKVWHPDRHAADPRLQRKADEKLKQINAAYQAIRSAGFPSRLPPANQAEQRDAAGRWRSGHRDESPPPPGKQDHAPPPPPPPPRGHAWPPPPPPRHGYWAPPPPPPPPGQTYAAPPPAWGCGYPPPPPHAPPPAQEAPGSAAAARTNGRSAAPSPAVASGARVLGWIAGFGVVAAIVSAFNEKCDAAPPSSRSQSATYSTGETMPSRRSAPPDLADAQLPESRPIEGFRPPTFSPPEAPEAPFFTLGSTRAHVAEVQGLPNSIDKTHGETWRYNGAFIEFRNGKVYAWSSLWNAPLRVGLTPSNPDKAHDAAKRGHYTIGSSKDEVIAIQGTPTTIDKSHGENWWYGAAWIEFKRGKVYSWNQSWNARLAVELHPKSGQLAAHARGRGSYGPAAAKDEVLAIEGTPDTIDRSYGETWWYGPSTLKFRRGKVIEWNSSPARPLRLMTPPEAAVKGSRPADETATLEGFTRAIRNALEGMKNEICRCQTLACGRRLQDSARSRGFDVGFAYAGGKRNVSPELVALFARRDVSDGGDAVTEHLKHAHPAWFAEFSTALDACIKRLK
jgi:hypothetical protein